MNDIRSIDDLLEKVWRDQLQHAGEVLLNYSKSDFISDDSMDDIYGATELALDLTHMVHDSDYAGLISLLLDADKLFNYSCDGWAPIFNDFPSSNVDNLTPLPTI